MASKQQDPKPSKQQERQPPKQDDSAANKESYAEWAKRHYNSQYENWMPWVEDQYLRWFTKDNKTSYATKQQLEKTKVTGVGPIDNLQDGVHNTITGQMGQGGIAQPLTDTTSKEGINRAERQGKGDDGSWVPKPVGDAGGKLADGAKGLGGAVGGVFGSGKK